MHKTMMRIREECQKPRRYADTWYGRIVARRISAYLTFIFLSTGMRANTATFLLLASGLASAAAFSFGGPSQMILGALLLQLWYVLDHVDGEIARFRKECSLTGVYFDKLVHYISHPLVFFGIGWGLYRANGDVRFAAIGMLGGFSVQLLELIIDAKELVHNGNYREQIVREEAAGEARTFARIVDKQSLAKKLFSLLYFYCSFPVFMNLITLTAVIDFFLHGTVITKVIFVGYVAILTAVWVMRMTVLIIDERLDHE